MPTDRFERSVESNNHLPVFGRWSIDMPSPELTADVIYQICALDGLCRVAGNESVGRYSLLVVEDTEQPPAHFRPLVPAGGLHPVRPLFIRAPMPAR